MKMVQGIGMGLARRVVVAGAFAFALVGFADGGAAEKGRLLARVDKGRRPAYHSFVDGNGLPGDPNGAFYADGRYHLMSLHCVHLRVDGIDRVCCRWAHKSSADLLTWTKHEDAIREGADDNGAYSGGAFVDDDGTCFLSYWMIFGARGVGIVRSDGRNYTRWTALKAGPAIPGNAYGYHKERLPDGTVRLVPLADPSNIWKKDGRYYLLCGNLMVLEAEGRKPDSPEALRGDVAGLFVSNDLREWKYIGAFYQRRTDESRATGWTDPDEDCMCPTFLELPDSPDGGRRSGKYLLSFISHNRGCQYYIGTYDKAKDLFLPESHGRMTWRDRTYFAPEAMIDGKGRQLLWAWIYDDRPDQFQTFGWCGVYAIPRSLWLREDGTLGISVPEEFKRLRRSRIMAPERGFESDCCELALTLDGENARRFALEVKGSKDGIHKTIVRYDDSTGELVFDATHSGADETLSWWTPEGASGTVHQLEERAPFRLGAVEKLSLRVFIDGDIVEVFANDRQAISRRVFSDPANRRIMLHGVTAGGFEAFDLGCGPQAESCGK